MFRLMTITMLLAGCGALHKKSVSAPAANPRAAELRSAQTAKLAELQAAADPTTGWPSATDCDGTLWASEAVAAGDLAVHLELAEQAPGVIHRRPGTSGECYPAGSAATVSRDMLIGYVSGMYARKDVAALERLADYGEAHAWVMGTGPASDTFFTPDGQGTVARAIKALGGGPRPEAVFPAVCLPVAHDYELHIQTVGALLNTQIDGGVDKLCVDQLAANAHANPKDALLQAAFGVFTGDMGPATELLLDPAYAAPSYVRGAPTYATVHWLFAAHVVLSHTEGN